MNTDQYSLSRHSTNKTVKTVPIFKKGDSNDVNNYRPISIVFTLSKMLEKVVYARLLGHLDPLNILSLLAMYCFSIFCGRGDSFILHAVILLSSTTKDDR